MTREKTGIFGVQNSHDSELRDQMSSTKIGAGSSGALINLQPGFQPGGTLNLLSITIDFVF